MAKTKYTHRYNSVLSIDDNYRRSFCPNRVKFDDGCRDRKPF